MIGEVEVAGPDQWEEIRRRADDGASIRTIARELDLDRKAVRRCLRQTEWRKPYQRAAGRYEGSYETVQRFVRPSRRRSRTRR